MFTPTMCHMSRVICHVSGVTCHMSGVRCQVSCVTFFSFLLNCQIGGAFLCMVCYQRPRGWAESNVRNRAVLTQKLARTQKMSISRHVLTTLVCAGRHCTALSPRPQIGWFHALAFSALPGFPDSRQTPGGNQATRPVNDNMPLRTPLLALLLVSYLIILSWILFFVSPSSGYHRPQDSP